MAVLPAAGLMLLSTEARAVDELPAGLTNEEVSQQILSTISDVLPEGRAVAAEFLDPTYTPFVTLSKDAEISTTFVDEGAGYRNSLGYFSFSSDAFDGMTKADIDLDGSGVISLNELASVDSVDFGYVFPNSSKKGSGGRLTAGDTVELGEGRTFEAGTNVGFFLGQNTWNGSGIRTSQQRGSSEVQTMYSVDFLNPEASAGMGYGDDSSANSSRHAALMFAGEERTNMILGFEDLNRVNRNANDFRYRSDEDFNDAIFIVSSTPFDALEGSNVYAAPAPRLGGVLSPVTLVLMAGLALGFALLGQKGNRVSAPKTA